jgi:hypothetical protein
MLRESLLSKIVTIVGPSRVRHRNAALVLGMFRRVVVSCAQAWLGAVQTPQTRYSVRSFQKWFGRRDGGPGRLAALVFAQAPTAWRTDGQKKRWKRAAWSKLRTLIFALTGASATRPLSPSVVFTCTACGTPDAASLKPGFVARESLTFSPQATTILRPIRRAIAPSGTGNCWQAWAPKIPSGRDITGFPPATCAAPRKLILFRLVACKHDRSSNSRPHPHPAAHWPVGGSKPGPPRRPRRGDGHTSRHDRGSFPSGITKVMSCYPNPLVVSVTRSHA